MAFLNRYLGAMVEVITAYQGTIDEIIGDAILVLFGAPICRDDDAPRAVACAVAVCALLVCERRGFVPGVWVTKLAASTLFVAAALRWGALDTRYGQLVLAALALCWLGDALLVPRDDARPFRAGIGSFALGHVVYAAAFLHDAITPR